MLTHVCFVCISSHDLAGSGQHIGVFTLRICEKSPKKETSEMLVHPSLASVTASKLSLVQALSFQGVTKRTGIERLFAVCLRCFCAKARCSVNS